MTPWFRQTALVQPRSPAQVAQKRSLVSVARLTVEEVRPLPNFSAERQHDFFHDARHVNQKITRCRGPETRPAGKFRRQFVSRLLQVGVRGLYPALPAALLRHWVYSTLRVRAVAARQKHGNFLHGWSSRSSEPGADGEPF